MGSTNIFNSFSTMTQNFNGTDNVQHILNTVKIFNVMLEQFQDV
jgi:hypothetical protein